MTFKERLESSKQYLIDILSETSTWRGIVFFVSFFLTRYFGQFPDEAVTGVAVACSYTVGILFKDNFLKAKVNDDANRT